MHRMQEGREPGKREDGMLLMWANGTGKKSAKQREGAIRERRKGGWVD